MTLARRSRSSGAVLVGALLVLGGAGVSVVAQIPGRNVNMVAGTEWPGGDPFLQRQNEPSMAASTRNPLHLVAGSNDYRTVDLPGLPEDVETGDAWLSVYKSFDGGQRWSSTLVPGYPQDTSEAGIASPLKGYQAAADPVVRAGTSGLIYYNGLVFDRGENGKSGIFVTRFIDRNNTENGDSVVNLGTSMVAQSTGAAFLDKPWMAVDIPRGNGGWCAVGGAPAATATATVKRNGHRQRRRRGNQPPDDGYVYVPAGAVYVAYTSITGDGDTLRAEIFLKRSMDCGVTWSAPIRVSGANDPVNQGASLAINPQTGAVLVTYRRIATPAAPDLDAIMVTRLPAGAKAFDPPGRARGLRRSGAVSDALDRIFEHRKKRARRPSAASTVSDFDQGTSNTSFRTNAFPTMTFDGAGRAYIAWTERGFAAAPDRNDPVDGDARILVTTTLDGRNFTTPVIADNEPPDSQQYLRGHQLMPSLAFAGGKLLLVYYDLRETRAQVFGRFVDDALSTPSTGGNGKRQTIDIRAALGTPGATPVFAPSVRVSDYLVGFRNAQQREGGVPEQLQVNPPNLPMFKLGTVPFIGDYIDVAPSPAFVPTAGGGWAYNTAAGAEFPVFHATWTDNRDVRPPAVDADGDGNKWDDYVPPTIDGRDPRSLFDPSQTVGVCVPGNAGSRNQNIYTARIGGGLLVGSPGNSKQLSPTLQRGFVVFAQNQTTQPRTFRMRVLAQPPGGRASFKQLLPPNTPQSEPPVTEIVVGVPPRSTASRTLYVTASDPRAQVSVDVLEVNTPNVPNAGLAGRVVLNPDIENPDIENPDIENPDIENTEVYNPDIENPDIENPDIENPDIENPDIENPDIENVIIANPDIENPDIENPDIENPDIENPDIENPDIENPDIENGVISDVTWNVSNAGNTTSAFNVNLFLASAGLPPSCPVGATAEQKLTCVNTQLIIYKTYTTPVLGLAAPGMPNDPNRFCNLGTETRNVLIANIPSPVFVTPGTPLLDQNDPSQKNATLWLAPGELGQITLRIFDFNRQNNIIVTKEDGTEVSVDPRFDPETKVTPGVAAQAVDQGEEPQDPPGATEPPVVTPNGTNMDYLWQPETAAVGAFLGTTVELNEVSTFFPVSVRVWLNSGAPAVNTAVSMTLATVAGVPIAGLNGNTTVSTDGVVGIATFSNLSVGVPGTYRLLATATASGATASGLSNVFTVGTPAVSFVQQPTAVNVGAPIIPPVSVRVSDAAGAVLPGVLVALTLRNSEGGPIFEGGTLSGATPVLTNAAGLAIFAGLSVNEEGFYLLRATATGVAATADSTLFQVASVTIPAQVFISNTSAVFNNEEQEVSVATVPEGLGTSVTYNGSTTLPTDIGAYAVVATVTAPGYEPASAAALLTIASTVKGGGPGGNPYGPLGCASGFADGFRIDPVVYNGSFPNPYSALRTGQLHCSDGSVAPQFGGGSTPSIDLVCPAGQNLVGIVGTTDGGSTIGYPIIRTIGPRCQVPGGVAITTVTPGPAGTLAGPAFSVDCPAGQAVTGVVGGSGEVIDSMALVCAPVVVPGVDLASRWTFDGNTNDAVGSNNAIATNALSYVPGRIGSGVSFATGGFVDIAAGPSLNLQRLTYSAWVNPAGPNTSPDVHGDVIFQKGTVSGAQIGTNLSWRQADGRFVFALGGAPSTQTAGQSNPYTNTGWLVSNQGFPAGVFYHVAATYDGTTMRLYVNGLPQGELAYTTTIPYDADVFSIGSNPPPFRFSPFFRSWRGVIDDLRVYGRALTPAEVLALYNAAPPLTVYSLPAMAGGTANTNCLPDGSCVIGPAGAGGIAPVDTGLSVSPGGRVTLTATGQVAVGGAFPGPYGPAGWFPNFFSPQAAFLAPSLNQFALVARIGSGPWQLVGAGPTVLTATGPSAAGGVLQLAVNDAGYDDNTGGFAVTVVEGGVLNPTAGGITSVTPLSGAPGEGLLVVRGVGFPAPAGSTVIVTNGVTTANGFILGAASTPAAYWVRLPAGFPLGPATLQIQNGVALSSAFPILVQATPNPPLITGLFDTGQAPLLFLQSGTSILVRADGIDTTGAVVRFLQAGMFTEVPAGAAISNATLGLAVEVAIPGSVVPCDPVAVSIRQGSSDFSPQMILTWAECQ